jgi:hypothetical protein
MLHYALLVVALLLATVAAPDARGQVPEIFRDADLVLGEKLIRESQCNACHIRRVGGDGSAIYRPAGRINAPGPLRGMVDMCSTELGLGLFPEESTAVAAVLNRDHYRFGLGPRPGARR